MNIDKYFDDFIFDARVKPVLTIVLPFFFIALYKGIIGYDWRETSTLFIFSIILLTFGAYVIRELGKKYEEKMNRELGGKPTTIVLRLSDDRINMVSKVRYHKWINSNFKDIYLPMTIEEERQDDQSDSKYSSVINTLRTTANSNRDKFPRVYQDLKKYNYWRNIYGCKWYALLVYLCAVFIQVVSIHKFDIFLLIRMESDQYIVLAGMLCWIMLFCCIVTKKTVLRNAFDYAKTLVEIIEELEDE